MHATVVEASAAMLFLYIVIIAALLYWLKRGADQLPKGDTHIKSGSDARQNRVWDVFIVFTLFIVFMPTITAIFVSIIFYITGYSIIFVVEKAMPSSIGIYGFILVFVGNLPALIVLYILIYKSLKSSHTTDNIAYCIKASGVF